MEQLILTVLLSTIGYFVGWSLGKKNTIQRTVRLIENTELRIEKAPSEKEKEAYKLGHSTAIEAMVVLIKKHI